MTVDVKQFLLDRIPSMTLYRDETESEGMLEQLVAVLAHGIDGTLTEIDEFASLVDVDNVRSDFLPELASFLGFEFPYDLPEAQQRSFIRNAVALYRVKGLPFSLEFIISRIMGSDAFQIEIQNENLDAKTFDLVITSTADETADVDLTNKVVFLVNQNTPAGLVPTVLFSSLETDAFDPALYTMDDTPRADFEQRLSTRNLTYHTRNGVMVRNTVIATVVETTEPAITSNL